MEIRADSIQPARIDWIIEIHPISNIGINSNTNKNIASDDVINMDNILKDSPPELDFRFPVIILVVVLTSIIFMLFCRSNNDKPKIKKKKVVDTDETSSLNDISSPLMQKRHLPNLEDIARIQTDSQYGDNLKKNIIRTMPTTGII